MMLSVVLIVENSCNQKLNINKEKWNVRIVGIPIQMKEYALYVGKTSWKF